RRFALGAWHEDDGLTFFDRIERFPPAHAAVFAADGTELRRWRYWTPRYGDIEDRRGDAGVVERFRELLERSVRLRLRADVPVGSSLSGGLDSSAVVGLMARERERAAFTQNTFSACFDDDPAVSEGPQVAEVVRHTGVKSFRVAPTAEGLMAESTDVHFHQEEPFLSASIYLQWCVARLAREPGTTVLLAGYQSWFRFHQLDLLDRGRLGAALLETVLFNRRLRAAARRIADSARRFDARVA